MFSKANNSLLTQYTTTIPLKALSSLSSWYSSLLNTTHRRFSYGLVGDTSELIDSNEDLNKKIEELIKLMKHAKHIICFTGAGVSTMSGIPDYRSGFNTVLPTGPGLWETIENKNKFHSKFPSTKSPVIRAVQALPSKTHMAISELIKKDIVKFLVTQNVDGLHRKSGIPEGKMAELHGTINIEKCNKCHREHIRDYNVRDYTKPETDHITGRKCLSCGGDLLNSIVYFGEKLPEKPFVVASREVAKGDLCLALGSSLKVNPAARFPSKFTETTDKKLVIINLQKTHLDKKATLRLNGITDQIIDNLMQGLGLTIPEFKLYRRFHMRIKDRDDKETSELEIWNEDKEGNHVTVMKSIDVDINADKTVELGELHHEPFKYQFRGSLSHLSLKAIFYGHYGEEDLQIEMKAFGDMWEEFKCGRLIQMEYEYCMKKKKWEHIKSVLVN